MKTVFTNGCFDILHVGHVRYLKEAQKLGDKLVVGLNSDESVKRLKGEDRPLIPQEERKELLEALSCVSEVFLFDEDTPLNLIMKLKPIVLVKGGDYQISDIVGAKEVLTWGGEVKSLEFHEGHSTTDIFEKVKGSLTHLSKG
jgi:D-beta-D-heptose 7-phosphate kinase/D-beta-D-heptose 1-phosphate adenosyltransferase